ncbi:MAG: redoxin domain-containing protein [Planctomycetota bacterium]
MIRQKRFAAHFVLACRAAIWLGLVVSAFLGPATVWAQETDGKRSRSVGDASPVMLQMIRDDAIHEELDLQANQREQILKVLETVDPPWWRARNFPAEKQSVAIAELNTELRRRLGGVLQPRQYKRLQELCRQAKGTRMFTDDDVAEKLGISAGTVNELKRVYQTNDERSAKLQKELNEGKRPAKEANEALQQIKQDERRQVLALLDKSQQLRIGELTGKPFNFRVVKRMYPLAPELKFDDASWLQGDPATLRSLRGKVVAVHFYAFQCYNCVNNLPHYNKWHREFADDGLVVIGIQTPELSRERDPKLVLAAAKKQSLEYPILMDANKANWDAWSNTMWPSVYLIDKKGYIRRWWQGEMNWKGNNGEEQMRQTIQMLLDEPA